MTEGEAAPAAASEQPSTAANEQASRNLVMRVVAALVLAPVAIALAYLGGVAWSLLVTLAAIGLFAEWLLVTGFGRELRVVMPGAVALLLIGLCLMAGRIDAALDMLVVGAVAVALTSGARRGWAIAGLLYAAAAEIASVVLRLDPVKGFAALMFVLLVVWVTDIGGYFAGRGIGGPKLWVRVSPKKTWAGAAGGFVASLLVAACFAAFEIGTAGSLLALGAVLSVVSQFGDLFESAVKRRFGVKDSSHIIPGHGGLLDRLDGFVAAVIVAAIFGFLRGGADGVGRGLMVW
ncbi:phosphatidate cytidylyltransferase [Bradyrhizobium viridifuturi]|uniref:phosphatidate cytidylyltransferase n=3 Tax=Pseudomonadota TaxID=1224 RepID=UPI0003981275|nr:MULTISPECIES: phosphatidate cytidylyltransferase [Bradyrhizobium]ERF85718.1 MAG: phosphatidate cytidylyltransferase [Bradyrhizobium sp. DFCI-1]OYU63070.1 MAG: phosphatidate cytidylyltransferase [Bradyrhizobium sp. PARBB1]PSO23552.1 phosphatidate cytidylyltransferase [Bradyrhizobium sp. MOS004]QRI66819.1 phosphatidate cytidylyltransferase [Bradyrhizobium sp. PSBB068]MBR1019440.1 phosphatidate cytidylyltransferase [Bradyrhizobium viridifuturi]